MTTKPRYALYTRISKDPTGQSTAPARQEKECRALAKEKGVQIVDVYSDSDISGWRDDVVRPQYEAMLAAMGEGAYDGVIVWKLDRLMRRIVEFSRFWKVAEENNVALLSKNDSIDTSNPIGLAIVYLIVGLAQQESYNTSLRLKAKERELAEAGIHKGAGRRAYGMEPGWEQIVPEEAAIIRQNAERILAGESISSIVRDLNARGVPSAAGGKWSRRALTVLMQQARLFGWREHNGELVARGDWPAILDERTGRQLREVLTPSRGRGGKRTARKALLSGVLECGKCRRRMKLAKSSGTPVYVCPPKVDGGCSGTSVNAAGADTAVSDMVLHRLDSPNMAATLRARKKKHQGDADVEILAELADLSDRAEKVADEYADGEITIETFKRAQRKIDRRTDELNQRLVEIRQAEPLANLLEGEGGLAAAWKQMSTGRKRAVIDVMLDRVTVHNAGSPYFAERLRESLLEEAAEAEAAGDRRLATRRRKQAESRTGGGGSFRPERLEPIWSV